MQQIPDVRYAHAGAVADALTPELPVLLSRPHAARRAARFFVERFPGSSIYAVKANPAPELLQLLWDSGIRRFDVASIAEVRLVRDLLPDAELCFMHPIKSEANIAEAYHEHGVRVFALDHMDELDKIERATGGADDLVLCVRLQVPSEFAEINLSAKFGIPVENSTPLVQRARQVAERLGLCFHVGSQAMSPLAYVHALERVRAAIVAASVTVDIVNVGGGFPSIYPGLEPSALDHYFAAIYRTFEDLPISYSAELWCEPGRALCAEYNSLIVRVERRRGQELFINDGAYGSLFDAAHLDWRFPVRSLGARCEGAVAEFSFYGPTCDDLDHMAGPFELPDDIATGDYVEIGMLGAYGAALRTGFNGFGALDGTVEVADEPMASLYTGGGLNRENRDNVVRFPGG